MVFPFGHATRAFFVAGILAAGAAAAPAYSLNADAEANSGQAAADNDDGSRFCSDILDKGILRENGGRIVCADIVALDQTLVYNRFGSFNPYGMIFSLSREVVPLNGAVPVGVDPQCENDTDSQSFAQADMPGAGDARLRDCKRPRPLVLRANVGDTLVLRVTNLLQPMPGPDFSAGMCAGAATGDRQREAVRAELSRGSADRADHGEVTCDEDALSTASQPDGNWPRTRNLSFVVQGMLPLPVDGKVSGACLGTDAVPPGETFECHYLVGQEGTHFFASNAAPSGGEGDGGSVTHGLFGALLAERPGTRWYRSQVSPRTLDQAWQRGNPPADAPRHARMTRLDYEATDPATNVPYLNMAQALDVPQADFADAEAVELVHGDLNAIVFCDETMGVAHVRQSDGPLGCAVPTAEALGDAGAPAAQQPTQEPDTRAFREFSVFFHDELKTFYTRNFAELGSFGQLAGVRDGFAINYGASGMGTLLLANRKGIGPAASCMECLYEEFFLTSWANGDPALLEVFDADPSNVHHSYLNDPVVFRNFHAGPKETHVFHLHAHQWFSGNDPGRGSYLDSQTVGPAQGFTHNIYHGGRDGRPGKWAAGGSGNRNRTVGDSIFHCHLYPHFAQGMWALWRVHDVLEDGTRKLPDGQAQPGLSTYIRNPDEAKMIRQGSVDPETGRWSDAEGTPIPALVPLPGEPVPPLPSYAPNPDDSADLRLRAPKDLPGRFGARRQARMAADAMPEKLFRTQMNVPADSAAQEPSPVTSAAPDVGMQAQTAAPSADVMPDDAGADARMSAMPGYPFYIAGKSGHRPPQAPLDIAKAPDGQLLSGGLGRHVVTEAERTAGVNLPKDAADADKSLSDGLSADRDTRDADAELKLERLRAQILAKAVAMGDMTAHLHHAEILTLPPEGTELEKAAMAFHHNGAGLGMTNPDGTGAAFSDGGYQLHTAPVPGASAAPLETGRYEVNASPARPGAPFADPCGVAPDADRPAGIDPLTEGGDFAPDPKLIGFRRYEASAVQLDMVVNKAGWHDPQARINVLTANSDTYKLGEGIISPRISDQEEPFFFRALSGECIEFRHTNELPKELALDDFQVKTPTDTIGQHIHLVKFDVTASDGSGNGWNYEDGTFAADELMARRCAVAADGFAAHGGDTGKLAAWGTRIPEATECESLDDGGIWRRRLGDTVPPVEGSNLTNRDLFQTTTQRWFADPILTRDGDGNEVDRTMRTVFSHDHFGPSSIQQHGFYTALLIEPYAGPDIAGAGPQTVCPNDPAQGCTELRASMDVPAESPDGLVGASKMIDMGRHDPLHPNYREYALAIADFALLYDPRDRTPAPPETGVVGSADGAALKGMATLFCEADYATRQDAAGMESACGSALVAEGGLHFARGEDVPPAWLAGGRPGDRQDHRGDLAGNLFLRAGERGADGQPVDKADADILREQLLGHRLAAAYPTAAAQAAATDQSQLLAQPVAAPARPESISVDHHDPYLVNYRMAALPLRLGTKNADGSPDDNCAMYPMSWPGRSGAPSPVVSKLSEGSLPPCSFRFQLAGERGDAAFAFSSRNPVYDAARQAHLFDPARDPETPILEGYQGERLVFRLIQGAQEVQHVFNVAGLPFRRNIDQTYPQAMRPLAQTQTPARAQCFAALRRSHPEEYDDWLRGRIPSYDDLSPAEAEALITASADPAQQRRWHDVSQALARCDNIEGMVFAQEVGISEHFEMRGRLRQDVAFTPELRVTSQTAPASQPAGSGTRAHHGDDRISDYLYNFGTLDSLWNGDWGLIRIYQDEAAPDPHPLEQDQGGAAIGDRLAALQQYDPVIVSGAPERFESASASPVALSSLVSSMGLPTCPLPVPGRKLRITKAYVVAMRTFDLYTNLTDRLRGTPYGMGQFDRNGQMLALLPELPNEPDQSAWGVIDRNAVLSAVRAAYDRPEPFTLRVNAGDCVMLRFINTLTESSRGAGGVDLLGDAVLPPITPLNTDPEYSVDEDESGLSLSGEMVSDNVPETGLRPSARLALTLGLPGGAAVADLPLGFGINAAPMEAASGKMATISPLFAYYAGRVAYRGWPEASGPGSPWPACARDDVPLSAQLDNCTRHFVGARLDALRTQYGLEADPPLELSAGSSGESGDFTYSAGTAGKTLKLVDAATATPPAEWLIQPMGPDPFAPVGAAGAISDRLCSHTLSADDCAVAVRSFANAIAAEAVQAHMLLSDGQVHWIPYAYGSVPLRVTGDMISQPAHGMFGSVIVVPRHWQLPGVTETVDLVGAAASAGHATDAITDDIMRELGLPKAQGAGSATLRSATAVQGFGQGQIYVDTSIAATEGGLGDVPIRLREFVLYYQDGLNLRDVNSRIVWRRKDSGPIAFQHGQPVPDCSVCDDSYDRGEQGVNYRSAGYVPRLREMGAQGPAGATSPERHHSLNAWIFPNDFFSRPGDGGRMPLTLQACQGEQVVIRVVHPGGRARQRAFVMNGLGYDDLFPGFGFPNSALLAPGKAVSAWLTPRAFDAEGQPVSYLWSDGPTTLASGGTWGLLQMLPEGAAIGETTCPAAG
ncbi:hypothetical protein FQV27_07410 [Paracoccus aurantiacus]|uniref:Copper oxidase n=1 Tax=Paracoccus aurantiacus TaxID=2599412 RepID=A0A5C6S6H4_9RHOB|nr:hypothetical protein [Paracoccus aurantiacus]TXB69927.1 hypothetical protein FQV27_07410 [Paracoccus aurantiacus]